MISRKFTRRPLEFDQVVSKRCALSLCAVVEDAAFTCFNGLALQRPPTWHSPPPPACVRALRPVHYTVMEGNQVAVIIRRLTLPPTTVQNIANEVLESFLHLEWQGSVPLLVIAAFSRMLLRKSALQFSELTRDVLIKSGIPPSAFICIIHR
jgi:hypothetical protein